jgi:hypothetical protein
MSDVIRVSCGELAVCAQAYFNACAGREPHVRFTEVPRGVQFGSSTIIYSCICGDEGQLLANLKAGYVKVEPPTRARPLSLAGAHSGQH